MANPPCQFDDGNAAIFTGTNFDTGDSVMLCPPCLVSFCATIIEGMTGIPVSALIDAAQSGELELGGDEHPDGDEVVTDDESTGTDLGLDDDPADADSTLDQ